MSYLRKYARPKQDNLTEQYNTRLTKDAASAFESYCKDVLNISPSEAIRLLILEELSREGLIRNPETDTENQKTSKESSKSSSKISKRTSPPPKRNRTGSKSAESEYLASLKVDGQLPCPVCKSWSSSGHFRGRHAAKHGFSSTYEFLKAHEEDVKQMHKTKIELP